MALNLSRRSLVLCAGATLTTLACSSTRKATDVEARSSGFDTGSMDASRSTVLVLLPFRDSTLELWTALRDELSDEFNVVSSELDAELSPAQLQNAIESTSPKAIVLIGDEALRSLEELQRSGRTTPPALILMTSFAEQAIKRLNNCTGISYEVPGLTSFVTLRRLTQRPVNRIGVLYRPELQDFISKQAEMVKMENLELVGRIIEGKPAPRRVRRGLRDLLRKEKVDALWVLNDSSLLSPANLRNAWLPEVRSRPAPVVVGVSALVNPALSFGSIAVVPDHEAMGVQAANLLFDIADAGWQIDMEGVELPFSVRTVVDMSQAGELKLVDDSEKLIDQAIS